jgi:hypothetical protein
MFRFLAVFTLLWGAAGITHAGPWSDAFFDESGCDFGTVPRGMQLSHQFRVVNKSKDNVSISNVRVSCGCVSASALKYQLGPGEETVILANMDSRRFFGFKQVTVFVTFSAPRFEETRLNVQAVARDDVSFAPESIAMGKVKKGESKAGKMTMSFTGGAKITEISSESAFVQPTFKDISNGAGTAWEIEANLRGDTPPGRWYTEIWVKTANPNFPKLRVPVTVEVETALSTLPTKVNLGEVKAGLEVDRQIMVRGPSPFRITNITGTDGQIQVRQVANDAKTVHILTLTLNPARVGELNRTIQVETDLKSNGKIAFDAHANVVP